jgi:Co/Zn/Cd efflux system component
MMHDHDHCCPPVPAEGAADAAFRRGLWIVLALNATMFFVEAGAGLGAGSVALQADALDFLGDSANYIISLMVLGLAVHWRTRAAALKGWAMGAFGLWVIGAAIWRLVAGGTPDPVVMGSIGALALVVNVIAALVLYRFRGGDANMHSVWLCSRNDAISNIAVMAAASGVFATGSFWPDLAVALIMAGLALTASFQVLRHAARESAEHGAVHNQEH